MPYLSLFASAFLAATLLPFYSEILLSGLLLKGYNPLLLWASATAGNTLGAVVNWHLGARLLHFQDRRWFPFKPNKLERAQQWFSKYGTSTLLLAWLPVVGDPLTFIAGMMKIRLPIFLIMVTIGKGVRYGVILALTLMAQS